MTQSIQLSLGSRHTRFFYTNTHSPMAAVGSFDDETIGRLVSKIVDEVQDSMLNFELQKAAQEEVRRSNVRVYGIKDAVITGLRSSGWDMRLRNEVYKKLQTQTPIPHPLATPEQVKEPISYIRKAQMNWEKRILKSVNSMCTELSVPLAKKRPEKDQKDMAIKWTELGTDEPDLSRFRPVYAPKDFLEVVSSLKNPNLVESLESAGFSTRWGIVQATLETKDLHDLRLQFSDMSMTQCQGGIDDTSELQAELFLQERERLARKVVDTLHGPVAQEFAKKGCPITYRVDLWKHILGVCVNDIDALYYSQLKANVLQHDMLVDNLIYKDVKLTASNDDQYFVFEDYLYQVLLPFSRDTMVLKHFAHSSATPAKSYIRGKLGVEAFAVTYPPNGVIPFHGFAMYVAPLCFIYNDPIILYFMFREFYTRYFFHLHTLSSHPQVRHPL
ncbi:TBC1 domain family member 19 [Lamellibrachia satsuma]|nr:TBC1 domain family member 19 [Lamellibrachia satsuma]